jgi:hypothetical protein
MLCIQPPWNETKTPADLAQLPDVFLLGDHLDGIDHRGRNLILDRIEGEAQRRGRTLCVSTPYLPLPHIQCNYPHISLSYPVNIIREYLWQRMLSYRVHPDHKFQAFLCSFNGSPHVGRRLLTAALHRRGWYDALRVTKNFAFDSAIVDGHIQDFTGSDDRYWRKFFIGKNSPEFFSVQNSMNYDRGRHEHNAQVLESALTTSFVHVVSESMSTTHEPFITEKFLHSISTRGLFVAYAQPGWHHYLERYWGFRLYRGVFDYSFDLEPNPVKRLVLLLDMLSRFSNLDSADWRDLYQIELDNIEHNYDWFYSGDLEHHMTLRYQYHE